jgi:hypothetical protein
VQTPQGPYVALQPAADSLDIVFTGADVANFNQCALNGPVLLLVRNDHATLAKTFTLTSSPDARKRTGDITTYSLAVGESGAFLINQLDGWRQASDGMLYFAGSDALIKFACINPNGAA